MNNQQNIKSPRGSIMNSNTSNQFGEVVSLQQSILEKDQLISNLQGIINKL